MKIKYLVVLLLVFLVTLPLALADVTIAEEDLTFEVSYTSLDDDEEEVTITHTVTLTNDGVNAEDVTLTLNSEDADYSIDFVDSADQSFNLASGATYDVELSIEQDISGTDQGIEEDAVSVLVETVSGQSDTFVLDADIVSMFELKEIEFHVNDNSDNSMDEGDSDDDDADQDVEPGDKIEMFFEIENLFDEDYRHGDLDFEITVTLDDRNFGEDIDEDLDFTLDSGDETDIDDDDFKVEFNVPNDAEEDDEYELEIRVVAEDENNVEYELEWLAHLSVERDDDDVRIDEVTVTPSSPACGDIISISVDVVNYGSDDQDHAAVTVISSELDIDLEEEFSLDPGSSSDNDEVVQFSTYLPDDIEEGTYEIEVKVYYDYNKLSYTNNYDLVVDECVDEEALAAEEAAAAAEAEAAAEELVEDALGGDSDDDNDSDSSSSSQSSTVNTVEKSSMKDEYIVAMIIVSLAAVLALIFVALMLALRK